MLNKIEKHRIEKQFLQSLAESYVSYELGNLPSMLAPQMIRDVWSLQPQYYSCHEYLETLKQELESLHKSNIHGLFAVRYIPREDMKPILLNLRYSSNMKAAEQGYYCICDDNGKICKVGVIPVDLAELVDTSTISK